MNDRGRSGVREPGTGSLATSRSWGVASPQALLVGASQQADEADRVTPINGSLYPWRRAGRPIPLRTMPSTLRAASRHSTTIDGRPLPVVTVDLAQYVPDELLTVAEVAQTLRLNPQTVRNMIDRGEIPAIRVGSRRVRVERSDLDAFLAEGRRVTRRSPTRIDFDEARQVSECRSRHPSASSGARARCTSSSERAPTRLRRASPSQCRAAPSLAGPTRHRAGG